MTLLCTITWLSGFGDRLELWMLWYLWYFSLAMRQHKVCDCRMCHGRKKRPFFSLSQICNLVTRLLSCEQFGWNFWFCDLWTPCKYWTAGRGSSVSSSCGRDSRTLPYLHRDSIKARTESWRSLSTDEILVWNYCFAVGVYSQGRAQTGEAEDGRGKLYGEGRHNKSLYLQRRKG